MIKYTIILLIIFINHSCTSLSVKKQNFRSLATKKEKIEFVLLLKDPRGGYGDIASNYTMAKKLKDRGHSVTVVYSHNTSKLLKVLNPGFDSSLKVTTIDGIRYVSEELMEEWPKGDALITFSFANVRPINESRYQYQFIFNEYSDIEKDKKFDGYQFIASDSLSKNKEVPLKVKEADLLDSKGNSIRGKHSQIFHSVAGISKSGLYINEVISDPPLDRLNTLKKFKYKFEANNINYTKQDFSLGFSYTNKYAPTQLYIDGVKEYINLGNIKKPIILIVKDFPELKLSELPENLKVITYDRITDKVFESLIAHSDIPISVTGDVSLTYALEYEKVFFYEQNPWKIKLSSDIVDTLFNKNTTLGQDKNSKTLKYLFYKMLTITDKFPEISKVEIANILKSEGFQHKIKKSISQIRKNILCLLI